MTQPTTYRLLTEAHAANGYVAAVKPEAFGAVGDGVTDDGPAFSAAYAAASALAAQTVSGVKIVCKPGTEYRIKTSILVQGGVSLDMRGSQFVGPITGAAPINSGNNPAVPAATDLAGQTAGACFTDSGGVSNTVDGLAFYGGRISGFRYGMLSNCYAWVHPYFEDVQFENCNIGFFVYQGAQEPHLIRTASVGGSAGTTFVASATCFPAGHPYASGDNGFCDGLLYDNHGAVRDISVQNDTFDAWFAAAILRPSTTSVFVDGSYTFNFDPAVSSALKVSGRNIYLPSRNHRLIFTPEIRRAHSSQCPRGAAVIGNPVGANIGNISGELMFANGPEDWVLVPLSNTSNVETGHFYNIETKFVTNTTKHAVEIVLLTGSENGTFTAALDIPVNMVAPLEIFRRPELGVGSPQVLGGNYTIGLRDIGTVIEINSSSPVTVTLPDYATTPFPQGAVIEVCQVGTGQVTIDRASTNGHVWSHLGQKTAGQYATARIRARVADIWVLSGDLTA